MLRFVSRKTSINVNIYHNNYTCPNAEEIKEILTEYHSNPTSGHSGYHRTYNRIKDNHIWKDMKRDIKRFLNNVKMVKKINWSEKETI